MGNYRKGQKKTACAHLQKRDNRKGEGVIPHGDFRQKKKIGDSSQQKGKMGERRRAREPGKRTLTPQLIALKKKVQ